MKDNPRTSTQFADMDVQTFIQFLQDNTITRCSFVFNPTTQILEASHPELDPIARFMQDNQRDFLNHEGIFLQLSKNHNTLFGAFVHKTNRGQGQGGMRYWGYKTLGDFLCDGLRLSKGMTRKNALAGLWWGGGKGIMAHNPSVDKTDPVIREALYREYGAFITSLKGCYITAEDVGTNVSDMSNIFLGTRFATCISPLIGGSGNPSLSTARGVVCGMEAALEFLGMGTLEDKVIAVQGTGNVGTPLIGFLLEKGVKKIIAVDIHSKQLEALRNQFPTDKLELHKTEIGDNSILSTDCDILAPCAIGGILNPTTIPTIQAKIVCGATNNQLEDSILDDQQLFDRGIVYVPDFLVNRMGIVNCANEQYGHTNHDKHIEKHLNREWEYSVFRTTWAILERSKATGQPTAKLALQMADTLSEEPHPIFGHRGREIVESLMENRWVECETA